MHKEKPKKQLERISIKQSQFHTKYIDKPLHVHGCPILASSPISLGNTIHLTTALYFKMSDNPDDRRRARKPQGFFSEKQQEQRNEAVRGQLEEDLPIRLKSKRGAPDDSQAESVSVKKKQKKEEPKPKPLDVEAFLADLKTDYSKKKLEPMPPRPPKQKLRPVKTAITDRAKAPKGWNPREPDLINE